MTIEPETPPSEQGVSRREFVSSATLATAVAATLPAVLPVSASAQRAPASDGASFRSPMIKLDKRTPRLWQVTIANPPFNLVAPEMVSALHSVVKAMDRDPEVKVVVFKSDLDGFF